MANWTHRGRAGADARCVRRVRARGRDVAWDSGVAGTAVVMVMMMLMYMWSMMMSTTSRWWWWSMGCRRRPVTRPRRCVGSIIRQTATAALRRPRLLIGILRWRADSVWDLNERWSSIIRAMMIEISGSVCGINDRLRIHGRSVPQTLQIDITQC